MAKADVAVFIGRFQPVHAAHIKIIQKALDEAETVVVIVGSNNSPRTLKNPWSARLRCRMLSEELRQLPEPARRRVVIDQTRDYVYQDTTWAVSIQNIVSRHCKEDSKVKLIGHFKDDSSYYLKMFPQWELVEVPNYFQANSRDIRRELFESGKVDSPLVGEATRKFLTGYRSTEEFAELAREHQFLLEYKEKWSTAPFPPIFTTTDAVVVMSGHILLVRRKLNPGKGLLALPGGFVKQDETILQSCLRELKEETSIVYPRERILASQKSFKVFDHPLRDPRGRTITHAYFFSLPVEGSLPSVRAGDDAAKAFWVPISDLPSLEAQFFSDHFHIINYFVYGGL